jgi:hypothetical protein
VGDGSSISISSNEWAPYLNQLGYNATLKIDDKDFNATNPGVWCHNLQDLLGRDRFTNWDQYGKDEIIK